MAVEALREAAKRYSEMYGVDEEVLFRALLADASEVCTDAIEDVADTERLKMLRDRVRRAIERVEGRNRELERALKELYDCIDYVVKVEEGEIEPEDDIIYW